MNASGELSETVHLTDPTDRLRRLAKVIRRMDVLNDATLNATRCNLMQANPFVRVAHARADSAVGSRALPALQTYQRPWLAKDIMAGLVLTAILVPVGMGYAEAAGLPAIYGLYATIVPLIAYAIFGPSRILVLGPDSSLAAIIAATIVPLAAGDPDRLVALAGMLALLTGGLCILAGLAHFGFITDLLSKPIRLGYLNGIALTVLIGQLPKLLGFSSSGENLIQETISLVQGVRQGMTNLDALAIGVACLAIVLIFKRRWPKIPGVLIAVVGATLVVGVFDLATVAGVSVVGPLPQGLPSFQIPRVSTGDLSALAAGAIAITLVCLRRHERAVAHLRPARRLRSRSEPGAHRAGCSERGRGVLSGVLDQQQFVTHPRGGIGGRQDSTDRRGRRAVYCGCCSCLRRRCYRICPTPPWAPW